MPSVPHDGEITTGHLLDGRVRHDQFLTGHRTGIEPVLLAAMVPARAGASVIEGGTGTGAGLLCLGARVQGISGVGIERSESLAALARANFRANGFDSFSVVTADISVFRAERAFDHAFANPPWFSIDSTRSPDGARDAARRAEPGLLTLWAERLAACLRPRGTLSIIIPATSLPSCLLALETAGCGSPVVLPLWPRAGVAAKLVLVRGVRQGRGPCRLLAGLVLHDGSGAFTAAAQSILRDGLALSGD